MTETLNLMPASSDPVIRSIHRMLNPTSIALVGATPRLNYGGRILQSLLRASSRVKVYPVNPKHQEIMGAKCYPSIRELPESPDVVGIVVAHDKVMRALEECADRGVGSAVIISAGFAERGSAEGETLQRQIGDFARESGIRICGPNCLGVANGKENVWLSSPAVLPPDQNAPDGTPRRIALVSQSGATAFGTYLSRAVDRGVSFSYIVSTGNEADLESSDFIRYLLDDDDTKVIACFIEGFKDGGKFIEVARLALERGKPLVMIKVGRSELGSRAAKSHTAAMTGSEAVHDGMFKQYGVVRVEDYDGLLEMAQLLAYGSPPPADGVAIVASSGGISSLTADKCGQIGLYLPELREKTTKDLNTLLEGFGWAANPVDATGYVVSESFPLIMDLLVKEPEVGTLVVACGVMSGGADTQAEQIIDLRSRTDKAIAFLWTASQSATTGLSQLKEANIPLFYRPEALALGLRGMLDYYKRHRSILEEAEPVPGAVSKPQKKEMKRLSSLGSRNLTEHESKELLSQWNIPITKERRASTATEAAIAAREIGYPVVLKIESPDIQHKTESELVSVGLRDEAELKRDYDNMLSRGRSQYPDAEIFGVLVQEMVGDGTEVIVGVSQDSQFGAVILFAMGGIFVEAYEDVALRVCPITKRDALEMIEEVRGARILKGIRGRPPADIEALVDTLSKVSDLAVHLQGSLKELDINPLAVLPKGLGVKALDALAVIEHEAG